MEVFVGRQPIFDRRLEIHGYELLFRSSRANRFDDGRAREATSQLLATTLLSIGIDRVLAGKRGFINFPREMLVDGRAAAVPPTFITIEVLESVEPDEDVVESCRKLKQAGYTLALDDFVDSPQLGPLIEMADILKIDILATPDEELPRLAKEYRARGKRLLAEKVETPEQYHRVRDLHFTYFQGYFFARPKIIEQMDVPGTKLSYLRLLAALRQEELDFAKVEQMLKSDVSLAFKMLRYVNSAIFHWRQPVRSLMQALMLLGEFEVRKWISLAALPELGRDKPSELGTLSMVRARFGEMVAQRAGRPEVAGDLFLMGMFSLLDAMVGRPLEELLRELNLNAEVRRALLDEQPRGFEHHVHALTRACEKTDWAEIHTLAGMIGLGFEEICDDYLEAMLWSSAINSDSLAGPADPEPGRTVLTGA